MKADTSNNQTVLVTGGSGFLGSWLIVALLRQGFSVRTTVRNLARESEVRAMIARQVEPGQRLTFHAADLVEDAGWMQATQGCDYVIHVASPMPVGNYRKQDILTPAREGTRRVLESATKAGVRRVVLTSSGLAALPPLGDSGVIDESRWTERPDRPIHVYARAKTLAERDAWAHVREQGNGIELATILPGFIQGPVMGADYSGSIDLVALMLRGKMPAVPRIGFSIVDVRDLADLHLRAMLEPAAAGERFVAAGNFLWMIDIATILRRRFGKKAAKVPTRVMPDWLARMMALFNPQLAQLTPNLGLRQEMDAAKAHHLLGWNTRPAAESIVDAASSLIELARP